MDKYITSPKHTPALNIKPDLNPYVVETKRAANVPGPGLMPNKKAASAMDSNEEGSINY